MNNLLEGQEIQIKHTPNIDMEEFVKHKECSKKMYNRDYAITIEEIEEYTDSLCTYNISDLLI